MNSARNANSIAASLLAAVTLSGFVLTPVAASAQDYRDDASHHRQKTKNDWRNAAIGSGALGALGFITHNNTLGILGLAGGAYSLSRYEHDRKSQSRIDQRRAALYSRPYINHNGHRYVRRTVNRNGERYYQYVRG